MADNNSVKSPTPNHTVSTHISSLFNSPRFFNGSPFIKTSSSNSDAETSTSPTSILETKKVSIFSYPFGSDHQNMPKSPSKSSPDKKYLNDTSDCKGLGLAIIDSLSDERSHENINFTKPKLKIQIPTIPSSAISPTQSPKSPADFGIKTPHRNSQFWGQKSPFGRLICGKTEDSCDFLAEGLSLSEMELSEDYTCVISHGPNPRTTRIYHNCVVEGEFGTELKKEYNLNPQSQNVVKVCPTCQKNLEERKHIYMNEKTFCCNECECEEMILDAMKSPEMGNGL